MPHNDEDLRVQRLAAMLRDRSPRVMARTPEIREAAVTLIVRPGPALELLLIQRVEREGDPWSGHMALPGGRRNPVDRDLTETALRETEEEVGLRLHRDDDVLGRLDEVAPRSRRVPPLVVTPFVARAPADAEARLDPREVAASVWIPLPALRDKGALDEVLVELGGATRSFPALRYGDYRIWGLTHRILMDFLALASEL